MILRLPLRFVFVCGTLLHACSSIAAPGFAFGVFGTPRMAADSERQVQSAIAATDLDSLAFVVANGLKAPDEPCSDAVYSRKKALLDSAKNGLVLSLAAGDWTECRDDQNRSAAASQLIRIRDLFFADAFSLGDSRIPLVRQSANPRFRNYPENARWDIGDVLFATINLPSNNNDFRFEAGRNSEFEDRLVANRNWLHQIFTYAKYRKLKGVVLFCDGNPLSPRKNVRRDGYAETRRQLTSLMSGYSGRVMVVHSESDTQLGQAPVIQWHGRLGSIGASAPWIRITVNPLAASLFTVSSGAGADLQPAR